MTRQRFLGYPSARIDELAKCDDSELTYSYDALDRMSVKIVPERTGLAAIHSRDVFYAYDLRGLQTAALFDSLAGPGVTNGYDGFGRMVSTAADLGGTARTLARLFDAHGNPTRLTFPDGTWFGFEHDGLDRMTEAKESGGASLGVYSYNPAGLRAGLARPGSAEGWTWDGAFRLAGLTLDLAGTASDLAATYSYNPASQVAGRAFSNDAYVWTGLYAVTRPYTVNGLNQYTAAGPAAFAYDLNGNLISDGATSFQYDIENRLVAAAGAKNATLLYDPLGRLVEVTSGGAVTRLLHDGDALVAEYDSAGTLLRRYIHGPGVDEPIALYEAGQRRGLHKDHQGSVIALSDSSGNAWKLNLYDEYGIPAATNHGRFQYTGQLWLEEIGLYHYKARAYSPTLGRFLQADPVGYEDQINLYAYVANDPVNETDSSGQSHDRRRLWDGIVGWAGDAWSSVKTQARRIPNDLRSLPGHVAKGTTGLPPTLSGGANAATAPIRVVNRLRLAMATNAAAKIESRAGQLASLAGRNSVVVKTPGGYSRVDLAGKTHYSKDAGREIAAPHVQHYRENTVDGVVRSVSKVGDVVPATMKDLDRVEATLKTVRK